MELSLKNREWKEFELGTLFSIKRGKRLIASDRKKGDVAYYSASSTNNGLTDFIRNPLFIEEDKIIVTTFCDAYFVKGKFTASDEITMMSNEKLNDYSGQFITRIIVSNKSKFAFGRKAFSERLERQKFLLPINSQGEPDYEFMEAYMRAKEQEKLIAYKNYITKRINDLGEIKEIVPLNEKEWGEFFIEVIAEINSGRDIYNAERTHGNVPYVTSTALNNGIGYYVGNINETLEKECLSVNRNGSVGCTFYHGYYALFSNDCRKLKLKFQSKYVGIFISHQITFQKDKYGYGYKMGTARLKRQKIMLPTNQNKEPDYEYMESYMKRMEYEKLKSYCCYLKSKKQIH